MTSNISAPEQSQNDINPEYIKDDLFPRRTSIFTVEKLNERYNIDDNFSQRPLRDTWNYVKKYYKPTPEFFKRQLFKRIPFVDWIREYNLREWALSDIISGITIGIVHIPQGLAYALLAGLPAVNGLYVSFFPVILYAFLGTSRHLSIGTFAVSSLMILSAITNRVGTLIPPGPISSTPSSTMSTSTLMMDFTTDHFTFDSSQHLGTSLTMPIATTTINQPSNQYLSNDPAEARVMVAAALALIGGIIHLGMALLHFGYVSVYLSDSIVQGFTTGSAIHVITSQIPSLLGIKIKTVTGQSKVIMTWVEIFKNIKNSNPATCIISAISIALFASVRDHINERFKGRIPVPVPIELIIVILGTGLSAAFNFNERWKVSIVGSLPLGIPAPTVPPVAALSDVIGDAIAISIVCFVINISMAKLFATKYKYKISPNQELFAYGVGNVVTSFFHGFPLCVALSRCAVVEGTGGKTQIVGIIASIIVLIVILVVGPLFRTLPNACLASIIVTAMKNMLLQTKQLPILWRTNKLEFLAWIITFLGVVLLDVDYGLYIGVGATVLLLIIRSQKPRAIILGYIPSVGIYEDRNAFTSAIDVPNIRIFRFEENIYYANVDMFKKLFAKRIDFYVEQELKSMNAEITTLENQYKVLLQAQKTRQRPWQLLVPKSKRNDQSNTTAMPIDEVERRKLEAEKREKIEEIRARYKPNFESVIIDCSPVNYMDIMGIKVLLQLHKDFKELGVSLLLCQVRPTVYRQLKRMKYVEATGNDSVHVTINDAVLHTLQNRAAQDSVSYVSGAVTPYVGVQNEAYIPAVEDDEPPEIMVDSGMPSVIRF